MTNPEKRVYALLRHVVLLRHGFKCYLSGQELEHRAWELHHIKHQGTYPHMRFDLDNCVPLAPTVHALDQKGELVMPIRQKMGDKAWFELNRRANIITSVDLDAVEHNLKSILRRGVEPF